MKPSVLIRGALLGLTIWVAGAAGVYILFVVAT
jgi:hypothetical protein